MSGTIINKLIDTHQRCMHRPAVQVCRGGTWHTYTWDDYLSMVKRVALGLQSLGVKPGDHVAIWSNSCLEWAVSDLAILSLGALTVPIYFNSTEEDVAFILENAEVSTVLVENASCLAKLENQEKISARLKNAITIYPSANDKKFKALDFGELLELGEKNEEASGAWRKKMQTLQTSDPATIIYTSGTTGRPKGVLLSHEQIISEVSDAFPLLGVTANDVMLSFLPYAHILGRIEIWGHALIGHCMAFAESIERLRDNLEVIRPTVIIAVPRIFEKIHGSILTQVEISPLKKKIFQQALKIGQAVSRRRMKKQSIPIWLMAEYELARRLVFMKILEKLGGRLRFAMVGGAPMNRDIAEFFHAIGLLLLEGYGLTETTAAVCVNTPFDYQFGTVGKPLGDVQVRIADDGEILIHSKKVMTEYYLDAEATKGTIKDGWFHTGDIGEFTSEGFLRITDRKKDLIKTAGGKYVAPQRLEAFLKTNPYISQVHIHGDQRKYIVALVTLNADMVIHYAKDKGLSYKDLGSLTQNPVIQTLVRQAITEANSNLAGFESIKNFAVLPKDFTIEAGELTPSLKIKRRFVDNKYRDTLDKLY